MHILLLSSVFIELVISCWFFKNRASRIWGDRVMSGMKSFGFESVGALVIMLCVFVFEALK